MCIEITVWGAVCHCWADKATWNRTVRERNTLQDKYLSEHKQSIDVGVGYIKGDIGSRTFR
jgi:hypothetical protein